MHTKGTLLKLIDVVTKVSHRVGEGLSINCNLHTAVQIDMFWNYIYCLYTLF